MYALVPSLCCGSRWTWYDGEFLRLQALNRFQKEDPTFKVHVDPDSKETIISGTIAAGLPAGLLPLPTA